MQRVHGISSSLVPGCLEGEEKKQPGTHTVCECVKYFHIPFVYVPVNLYCHVFTVHTLLLGLSVCESAPIAHYVIVYGAIYRLLYNVPGFSVHFDACTDSVYQAVFFSSPSKRPGDDTSNHPAT